MFETLRRSCITSLIADTQPQVSRRLSRLFCASNRSGIEDTSMNAAAKAVRNQQSVSDVSFHDVAFVIAAWLQSFV